MRIRTRSWLIVLALWIWGVASLAVAQEGDASGMVLRNAQEVHDLLSARSARLGTSAGPDPDTVYVGKSFANHTSALNYWNLYTGRYLPGTPNAQNTMWDWDDFTGLQAPDSLQGWWPYQREYTATGGLTLPDDQRPWWALDTGNVGNYVINASGSAKRTFGVVGYWHDDPGKNAGKAVRWTPLSGSRSAWCGLREHGDYIVKDAVTGNYYSGDVVAFAEEGAGNPTTKNLPGYVNQMDQMMYRDINVSSSQPLAVSFKYRTRMSTAIGAAAATRTGWFHGDPLAVVPGNFISSSAAGVNAPQDSFMVYVGRPVNDAACVYSDGTTRPVYDPRRRWFSEVLQIFGANAGYLEIFQATGNHPADTLDATPVVNLTVPAASIAALLSPAATGQLRLVFRCKTNRTGSDSDTRVSGYTSNGYGAVLLDDVTIDPGTGPVVIGDFETPQQGGVNAIDNRFPLPPGLQTTDVWRSTGKPNQVYAHVEALAGLSYNDLCGPPGSPSRKCNLGGNVMTVGNHDLGEAIGDPRFLALREAATYFASPTINLVGGPAGTPNEQGITTSIASVSSDYVLSYDIYAGGMNLSFSGSSWSFGSQSFPALQPNGGKGWGARRYQGFIAFDPEPQCFTDHEPYMGNLNAFLTSNETGVPDSVRLLLGVTQQCFRFAVTLGCNTSEGPYFDNVALAFVDLPGVPGQASAGEAVSLGNPVVNIWDLVNDTFPANETAGLPGTAAFDTAGALIRTGLNTAQSTRDVFRFDLPGDSALVTARNATVGTGDDPALAQVRLDMVFRILPGPGNYQISAGRFMTPGGVPTGALLRIPQDQSAVVVAGDPSFWGQFIANPGEVSAGGHHGGTSWDPLTWNSARCDTAELNIFPVGGAVPTGTGRTAGQYMSMYHELDPHFATLGVSKFWCFVVDTTKAGNGTNVVCNGTVPAWLTTVPRSRTGWDGSSSTQEFTPIIPDGLLTPGSHVQYFFRKSHHLDPFLRFTMVPDTNFITPQPDERSTDQHRWQQFSVLPDRWKATAFGGEGRACMLYVDLADRRGNEAMFVSMMDSIGGTTAAKRGAHNGWQAPGTTSLVGLDVRTNAAVRVSHQNSQPGSTWDMYGVKASESGATAAGTLGSRLANRAGLGLAAGREARMGPTPEMLRAYYRVLIVLTGDLIDGIMGPFANRSQDDLAILSDFLMTPGGSPRPRGLLIQGDGFGQSEVQSTGNDPVHVQFLRDRLGANLRNISYPFISGNTNDCADLLTTTNLTVNPDRFGVMNNCSFSNDVWERNPAIPESQEAGFYEDAGPNGPYAAVVVKPATPARDWVAITAGFDIEHVYSRYCDTAGGRLALYYYLMIGAFGSICQLTGSPGSILDTPRGTAGLTNFMRIGNSVMQSGASAVRFGVANTGRVQVSVYDVTGRRIRILADRVFAAGEHTLQWDGADDGGRKVARGVYFVRSNVQKDAGRVIVVQN